MKMAWLAVRLQHEHRRNQRKTRAQLERMQLAKFRRLVRFVAKRSRYYARIIAERRIDPSRARPEDFPILTKRILMDNYDDIATDPRITREAVEAFFERSKIPGERLFDRYRLIHGSGTSGEPCYVPYTAAEFMRGSSHFERLVKPRWGRRLAFVGATEGHFAAVSIATPTYWGTRLFYRVKTYDVNRPLSEIAREVEEWDPFVLIGYGRVLRALADRKAAGGFNASPRILVNGGEPLRRNDYLRIRDVFDARVRNAYAATEHLYLSLGERTPDCDTSYLLEDDLIFELRSDCTLVTNLFNRTLPLIRHRMGDVLAPADEGHRLHGPFTTIGGVAGRFEHAPVFVNDMGEEDSINPHVLGEFQCPGLRAFQFQIVDRKSFRFRAVLEPGADEAALERIRAGLNDLLARKRMTNVIFHVDRVDAVAPDPRSGKSRLIIAPNGDAATFS